MESAADVLYDEQLAEAASLSSDMHTSSSSSDELLERRCIAMGRLAGWCASLPALGRSEIARAAGQLHTPASGGVVWACLEHGAHGGVALEADAWLCWTQWPILPRCANTAPVHVLHALGIAHPLPATVCCRHLARVSSEWRERGAAWRDQLGVPVLQAFSLLCCAHAAMQLRGDDLISAPAYARGGGTLTESLNGQLGARPDVRRALASAPYVVADDGTMLPGRHVCVDLFADLGPHARAVPNYLTPLVPFLVEVGGALTSSALAAPEVVVSAPNPFESLLPKLMLQWDEPAFADVIFEFDGGIEAGGTAVYAHKLVLALTSPHFATMFTSGLVEGQGGKQRLPMDSSVFGPDALRLALCYAYQGELPLTLSTDASHHHRTHTGGGGGAGGVGGGRVAPLAPTSEGVSRLLELLLVSDYFELSHLKQTVERLIVEWDVLQVENVVDVLQHAVGAHASQLKASCVQYMRGMFDVVRETPSWAQLDEALKKEVTELRAGR